MIGTLGVIVTLFYTSRAANAAQIAARATVDSVGAAKRSAKAAEESGHGDRAWVCLDNVNIYNASNIRLDANHPADGMLIVVTWRNSGRTPAINATSRIDFRLINLEDEIPVFPKNLTPQKSTLGPGSIAYTAERFIDEGDVQAICDRRKRLIIYSRFEYQDIFKSFILRVSEITAIAKYGGKKTEDGKVTTRWINTFDGDQNRCT